MALGLGWIIFKVLGLFRIWSFRVQDIQFGARVCMPTREDGAQLAVCTRGSADRGQEQQRRLREEREQARGGSIRPAAAFCVVSLLLSLCGAVRLPLQPWRVHVRPYVFARPYMCAFAFVPLHVRPVRVRSCHGRLICAPGMGAGGRT